MSNEKNGYVYILSNPAMPGILKIGRSKNGGRVRAKEIYKQGGTGVPMPYKMEFELWCEDCVSTELYVHDELDHTRINQDREFFKVDLTEAIRTIMQVFGYDHNLVVGDQYDTIKICNIVSIEEAVNLFTHRTGADVMPPDIEGAVCEHLTAEVLCDALENYRQTYEIRMKAIKANKFKNPISPVK